ncbi:hypothetical protein HDF22_000447 [Mucilaginibacter lappiensis]|uniref:Arm DNA-binding domain-containing protein n=1 Tax=Mucilaginibacter lappiensis TaxID=354630 RepID=A0A841J9T1_9SPHI|nr:hypothetical protein [Mucilaginibacter lappiensis]
MGDWNEAKRLAKAKNDELRKLNTHLEQLRGMMASHYQDLQLQKKVIAAEVFKAFNQLLNLVKVFLPISANLLDGVMLSLL